MLSIQPPSSPPASSSPSLTYAPPSIAPRPKACSLFQEWILKASQGAAGSDTRYGHGESENDLAEMVHDFIENGSYGRDALEASRGDVAASSSSNAYERLQALMAMKALAEADIATLVSAIIVGENELDLLCAGNGCGGHCNCNCIRRLLVKRLRIAGHNANVCRSKWQHTSKLPGGEYEYVDVCLESDHYSFSKERIIIDLDFRSQFQIARPSQQYQAMIKSLPLVFVGKSTKLDQILQIMSEAAKCSLQQNSMHLPPWRTLPYMRAKWCSAEEREENDGSNLQQIENLQGFIHWQSYYQDLGSTESSQCRQHLRHLKSTLKVDMEKGIALMPILNGLQSRSKARRGTW